MSDREAPARAQPDEAARLREQVVGLQRELVVQAERANAALAEAQRRTYWLDRLNLDLDVTLGRPPVRFTLLAALAAVRRARRLRGRIRRLRPR